jgi:hypothetical protein
MTHCCAACVRALLRSLREANPEMQPACIACKLCWHCVLPPQATPPPRRTCSRATRRATARTSAGCVTRRSSSSTTRTRRSASRSSCDSLSMRMVRALAFHCLMFCSFDTPDDRRRELMRLLVHDSGALLVLCGRKQWRSRSAACTVLYTARFCRHCGCAPVCMRAGRHTCVLELAPTCGAALSASAGRRPDR